GSVNRSRPARLPCRPRGPVPSCSKSSLLSSEENLLTLAVQELFSPFYMLNHDLPLSRLRYGRDLLACGSSYITHIMPKASAAWLAQSCSGPRSIKRSSSRLE